MKIREATRHDAKAIAGVQVDTWRTAYKGIVCDSVLEALDYEGSAENFRGFIGECGKKQFAYVAESDEGEVAGFIIGGIEREGQLGYDGEIYAVYVRKEYQGRGIGKKLIRAAVVWLKEHGFSSLLLWVLKDNVAAREIYERLGGRVAGQRDHCQGCDGLKVVAYGWDDLKVL